MRRHSIAERPAWRQKVTEQGLTYAGPDAPGGRDYWTENAYYSFSLLQIERLEEATEELEAMCREAVRRVIDRGLWSEFGIPATFSNWIADSWRSNEAAFYGRFDLAFDGTNIKLLEYNADTPTGLIEAALIQWYWFQERFAEKEYDQWNSLHERLIAAWLARRPYNHAPLHFTSIDDGGEDYLTATYLQDTASQAGWNTEYLPIHRLGWRSGARFYTDEAEKPIEHIFKLYPWEWLFREKFGRQLPSLRTRWIEPPWKAILSNKALLVLLYEMFPRAEVLLPASFEQDTLGTSWVRKPQFGREGANTSLVVAGETIEETGGRYDMSWASRPIFQQLAELPCMDGNYPVLGAWVVDGQPAGLGIREGQRRITTNHSSFVPHVIEPQSNALHTA